LSPCFFFSYFICSSCRWDRIFVSHSIPLVLWLCDKCFNTMFQSKEIVCHIMVNELSPKSSETDAQMEHSIVKLVSNPASTRCYNGCRVLICQGRSRESKSIWKTGAWWGKMIQKVSYDEYAIDHDHFKQLS
jgi:hypothetical protein